MRKVKEKIQQDTFFSVYRCKEDRILIKKIIETCERLKKILYKRV